MSDQVRGVVVAHADLASALVKAVEGISGVTDALSPISNEGLGSHALRNALGEAVAGGPTIIFVDLAGGSCGLAGLGLAKATPGVAVLTGVNVPMLLDFVFHREMELAPLVERLLEKGRSEQRALACESPPPA